MPRKRRVSCKSSNSRVRTKQEAEFLALRRGLFAQLHPTTPLQRIAAEMVASCSWRCVLSIRLDAKSAAQLLGEQTPEAEGEAESETDPKVSQWYGASRESLRAATRFLGRLKADFEYCGRLRDDWRDDLIRCSGKDFFEDLKKWEPANLTALQLADQLVKHQSLFGGSLPTEGQPALMPDPLLQKEMLSKLLSQEIRHLLALANIAVQRDGAPSGSNGNALGLVSNHVKPAMDALQRAVAWFMQLRRHRL